MVDDLVASYRLCTQRAIAGHGTASRLHQQLVDETELAHSVTVSQQSHMLGSVFSIEVVARSGVALAELEKVIDAEVRRWRTELVSERELARAKNRYETKFLTRLQSLEQRVSMLASYWAFLGEADYAARDLARYRRVDSHDIRTVANATLQAPARVVLITKPSSGERSERSGGQRGAGS